MSEYSKLSKYLCKILRHHPEMIGIEVDEEGNVVVDELVELVNQAGKHTISKEILEEIVKNDQKGRYAYNEEHTLIRCVQGHSIPIVGTLKEMTPPDLLYHGTALKFVESIQENGLVKGRRNYVHLSKDVETAVKVGKRHGVPVVFLVDCKKMVEDGYIFKVAENGVWQINHVPSKYLVLMNQHGE